MRDIWILPRRGDAELPVAFHGIWIRCFDTAVDAWRSIWIDSVNGDAVHVVSDLRFEIDREVVSVVSSKFGLAKP